MPISYSAAGLPAAAAARSAGPPIPRGSAFAGCGAAGVSRRRDGHGAGNGSGRFGRRRRRHQGRRRNGRDQRLGRGLLGGCGRAGCSGDSRRCGRCRRNRLRDLALLLLSGSGPTSARAVPRRGRHRTCRSLESRRTAPAAGSRLPSGRGGDRRGSGRSGWSGSPRPCVLRCADLRPGCLHSLRPVRRAARRR